MKGLVVFSCLCIIAVIDLVIADISDDISLFEPLRDMNLCENLEDFRILPHPETCELYLMCWDNQVWKLNCDPGELFNSRTEICEPADLVNCHVSDQAVPEIIPECPIGFIGRHPHPDSCNRFFLCINGRRSIGECLPFLHFDMERRRCVPRSSARCM